HLDAFLSHARIVGRSRRRRQLNVDRKRTDVSWAGTALAALGASAQASPERQLEELVAQVFERWGAVVSRLREPSDRGVDMAVWIDDIESTIGNPLLVEVNKTLSRRQRRESRLKSHGKSLKHPKDRFWRSLGSS